MKETHEKRHGKPEILRDVHVFSTTVGFQRELRLIFGFYAVVLGRLEAVCLALGGVRGV